MANDNVERFLEDFQSFVTAVSKMPLVQQRQLEEFLLATPAQRDGAIHHLGMLAMDSAKAQIRQVQPANAPLKAGRKRRRPW